MNLDETLKERGAEYGDYVAMSETIQAIKDLFRSNLAWGTLHAGQREGLEMMATKIGRLLNGNPDNIDSWRDIAGYSTIVANNLDRMKKVKYEGNRKVVLETKLELRKRMNPEIGDPIE